MRIDNFFAELKRRNVYKVAVVYAVVAWLLIQAASILLPTFEAPAWVMKVFVALLVLCFPIALVLSWAFELTPEGIKRESVIEPHQSIARQTGRKILAITTVLAAIAIGLFVFQLLRSRYTDAGSSPGSLMGASIAKSVAVLPLVNTSGDPANEYFSDGLSEELIAVLVKLPELKVIGRSSSFQFKGKSADSRAIGEKLGVANLIEGSVRKEGDRVRIVASLINATDGRELWSETYDRELKDVFAVQSEIARSVAEQMKMTLLGESNLSNAAASNQNPAAHIAVLQSDFYFQRQTAESIQQAISFAQEAIRLDPNYALAYAKLSQAWRQLAASFTTAETEVAYDEARKAADKAASLSPDLVEVRKAIGWISINPALDFRVAEKEFRRALGLAPGDAGAKNGLSTSIMAQGRLEEADKICREALLLDPLVTGLWYNLGRIAVAAGRYDDAERMLRKGLEIQPHAARFHTYLATLDIVQNNATAALQEAQLEPDVFWREYALALVQQTQSDRVAADAALKKFSVKDAINGAYQMAVIHALRKEPDEMFRWLDHAYATHDSGLTQLAITPFIADYREDPRFAALCQKLGVQVPSSGPKR